MQSCSFIGHKNCPKEIKGRLLYEIEKLITNKGVNKFYVGTQGGFDKLVYETLCELEKKYEIDINVVLAYLNRTPSNQYYDLEKTIFPDELTKTPLPYAIRLRNSFMITYLNVPFSNAYKNVEEAIRKKKQVINLGNFDIESII
ncbi:MAG: hypothetical protein E7480_08120 [Ruminococcaceae bacterium]|nr:hypothetical protein [Oscillospiraceae bacterium]